MRPAGPTPSDSEIADVELINLGALRNWWKLAVPAIKAGKVIVLGSAALVMALAAIALAVLPKTYEAETKLLVGPNQVLAIRGDTPQADPSRAAAETVMRQDALIDLVKETHLLEEWPKRRAPILRLKDKIMGLVSHPTEAEKLDALLGYLRKQLNVYRGDGTVIIQVEWPDAEMSFRIVDAAERAFLEERHVQDVSTIAEASAILEGHASDARREVETAVKELETLRDRKQAEKDKKTATPEPAHSAEAAQPAATVASPPPAESAADLMEAAKAERRLSEIGVMIEAKQRTIRDLEDYRQKRLAELNSQLDEKRAIYTDAHPVIADIKQAIAGVSQESPQVGHLREELTQLQAEAEDLKAKTGSKARVGGLFGASPAGKGNLPGDVIRIEQESADERDPEIAYARARLTFAIQNYQQLQGKIDAARVDLDTAEAAFKYRYTVVLPPKVPRAPIKPKAPLVMLASAIGGLLLGLIAAIASELRRGLLRERWQVDAMLPIPVLGELRLPSGATPRERMP
jgi:uncharacterized protein involved in exopolysaccharide biosynthesis